MNFTVMDKQPGGDTGTISISQSGKAVEIWTLVADGIGYSTEDVRQSGVFPGVYTTFHAQNPRLRFQPVEIDQDSENPALFICTLTWSSEKLDPKEEDQVISNPIDRRARATVKTAKMRETRHRDFYGKPKVNSANDLFDPPIESNVSFKIITIRKKVTLFPDWVFSFDDAVNQYPFVIKGHVVEAGCAWMADIELGEEQTDGPVPYCEARLEIHERKRRYPAAGELRAAVPGPWDTEQLNEGLFCYNTVAGVTRKQRCQVKDDSNPPNLVDSPGPMPLDALGFQLPLTATEADLTFVVFRDHPYFDFNQLAFLWSNA